MHANSLAVGRNFYTAESAFLIVGDDWARWELHWSDGARVMCTEDCKEDAVAALRRYGFEAKSHQSGDR